MHVVTHESPLESCISTMHVAPEVVPDIHTHKAGRSIVAQAVLTGTSYSDGPKGSSTLTGPLVRLKASSYKQGRCCVWLPSM